MDICNTDREESAGYFYACVIRRVKRLVLIGLFAKNTQPIYESTGLCEGVRARGSRWSRVGKPGWERAREPSENARAEQRGR